ncbi:MAG TPA: methylmalonyl Co-A mutase-associated GTPase MeaB [Chloroflexi bacterium]|nr:methylmalonyl Co-A mutase-associated GTPase MeaB [Chloroflexota bacterium]
MASEPSLLVASALSGNRRAAGRLISMIEDDAPQVEQIMRAVYPHTGNAYLIGFTGPPGAGKSTLVDELVRVVRTSDQSVGIIAVDPNSPFTGGAILGDRIRMMRHATDPQVFIRSMGARGHLGGLAVAAQNASFLFDAMGMSLVLVETVGVGQSELEIAEMADTTVVVMPPGFGDGVQAIKAGIMEIADIFVVNKADDPMASKAVSDIRDVLRMDLEHREWTQPIVRTIATSAEGLEDLWMRIQQHRGYLEQSGELRRRRRARIEREIMRIAERKLLERVLQPRTESQEFETMLDLALEHRMDPYAVADHIVSFRDGR